MSKYIKKLLTVFLSASLISTTGAFADITFDSIAQIQEKLYKSDRVETELYKSLRNAYLLKANEHKNATFCSRWNFLNLFNNNSYIKTQIYNYIKYWYIEEKDIKLINDLFNKIKPINDSFYLYSGLEDFEAEHIENLFRKGKKYMMII